MTRVVFLLNNPFVADSRSWKLATSLSATGCDVTVVARARAGLDALEQRDGYRIVRVAQPRPLAWLPAPALPRGATGADAEAARAGEAAGQRGPRGRLRDTAGRTAQAGRFLLLTRAWAGAISAALEAVAALGRGRRLAIRRDDHAAGGPPPSGHVTAGG